MLATSNYRENRARFSVQELEMWQGQWVAFASDGTQIIAGAPNLQELVQRLEYAGLNPSDVVFERIEFDSGESFIGGAESL
jgi:hypothetical protein